MRLMSDVPLGAMLSGGLDSSLIVALMARHMDQPVETFAVGFAGEDSELPDARRVADALRRRPPRARGRRCDTRPDDLATLVWHLDEPLADLSSLGFLALCELAAEHVTVALSGQGADELFGGYRKHRVASLAEHWDRVARAAARRRRGAVLRRGPGRAGRLAEALQAPRSRRAPARVERARAPRPARRAVRRRAGRARRRGRGASLRGRLAGAPGAAPLEAALYLDARLGLVDDMLTYFDRASMACSLEVRVPFLDHELVELCARDPDRRTRCAACRASTSCALAARGPRARLRARRSASAASSTRRSAVARRRRRRASSTALLLAPTRPTRAVLDRAVVERAVARVARRAQRPRAAAARAGHARAVARRVPAARASRGPRPSGSPRDAAALRGRHARRATRRRTSRRLAAALAAQTLPPRGVGRRRRRLHRRHAGAARRARRRARLGPAARARRRRRATSAGRRPPRGRATSTASCAAPRSLAEPVDVVVKVDADVDFDARLLRAAGRRASPPTRSSASPAARATSARTASGCGGRRPRRTVWGASRAYRWDCLARRDGARAAHGLGRARRDQRAAARPAHPDVRRPAVPPPPAGGRPRADLAAPRRGARPRVLVHGLPADATWPCARSTAPAASRPRWR